MTKHILVTGGAGYIGSHMVRMLREEGLSPIIFDNLCTGHRAFIPKDVPFVHGDLRNIKDCEHVFKKYSIHAVIHFAASLVVPESMSNPLLYYSNNVTASCNLVTAMLRFRVHKLIFSSTAAVYGNVKKIPVTEDAATLPESPYGASKLMVEHILKDVAAAHPLQYISLRYFNVAGSHPRCDIGIRHDHITHLIPCVMHVANGRQKELVIFGNDYPTHDGTCIRDYIYVGDLCRAHLLALRALDKGMKSNTFNLGNGNGFSVKDVVDASRRITGKKISIRMGKRRPGDPAKVVASSRKAQQVLGWKPCASLDDIIKTSWEWECAEAQRVKRRRK